MIEWTEKTLGANRTRKSNEEYELLSQCRCTHISVSEKRNESEKKSYDTESRVRSAATLGYVAEKKSEFQDIVSDRCGIGAKVFWIITNLKNWLSQENPIISNYKIIVYAWNWESFFLHLFLVFLKALLEGFDFSQGRYFRKKLKIQEKKGDCF